MLRRVRAWYAQIGADPALARAQAAELRRQIPLLYGLLLISSIAVAFSHYRCAPVWLTLTVPAILFPVTLLRLFHWMRRQPADTDEAARRQLFNITRIGGVIGLFYVCWALMLAPYGGPIEQAHVATYISITMVGCIVCLLQLPQAAVTAAVCVLPAFLINFIGLQQMAFAPVAINVTLVVLVLLRVLFHSFESFRAVVGAREELAEQHAELIRLNEENRAVAMTDSLTRLPNRRCFYDDLERLAEAGEAMGGFTVGVLDLDRFKPVNDTFGHATGDSLLIEISERLRHVVGPWGSVYRLGGDEFGLLVMADEGEDIVLAERLSQAVAAPVMLGGRQMTVGASVGLARSGTDTPAKELPERADHALYHAKRHAVGSVVLFTPELETEIRGDQAIEIELRAAVLEDELDVCVQPIVDAETGRVLAGEVLVRWNSRRLGEVDPQRFISVAERSSLIHRITLHVVDRALAILVALPREVGISVNISACDLNSETTVATIVERVKKSGICAQRLWVEVTETAVMRDMDAAIRALGAFRACGIRVALDDFGTGYSSLSNLHRLPLDKVKIDRSFMTDLGDENSVSIAKAVITLCDSIGLGCVAEGVETSAQRDWLMAMGCTLMQGYYFARPCRTEVFHDLLAQRGHPGAPLTARVA